MIKKLKDNIYYKKFKNLVLDASFRLLNESYHYPELFKGKYKKIIILSPHPDDEVIGLGGFILKNKKFISKIYQFTSFDEKRFSEAKVVSKKIGIKFEFVGNTGRISQAIAVREIKEIIYKDKPDLICCPSFYETHTDHIRLYKAFNKVISEMNISFDIMYYEVWNTLTPNFIIDISDEAKEKKNLISLYKSQTKDFDYNKFIFGLNTYRGMQINKNLGEAVILLKK